MILRAGDTMQAFIIEERCDGKFQVSGARSDRAVGVFDTRAQARAFTSRNDGTANPRCSAANPYR